eukprot:TRINITY_DN3251_c0_g2_i1.p1 TRINITY_DN3251_c0_g2~~TRINITY_DN3251_c0_g2_i1.p1  ORF type:complete len:1143 (+),score=191.30 TRINITY_DN3251_c0_g2_i1:33-3461(+)
MPVPWGYAVQGQGAQVRIEKAEYRGMTLPQLRSTATFARRLCKMGVLKFPENQFNRDRNRAGQRIQWSQLTLHELTSEIMLKLIPQKNSCSWVEFISSELPDKNQKHVLCSHNWAEAFRDFVNTAEQVCLENRFSSDVGLWICAFALDQWQILQRPVEVLGFELKKSPFYDALHSAKSTILFLDKRALALLRIWVVFELHQTLVMAKDLQIWTPLGRAGSCLVESGPIVEALQRVDIAKADCTEPVDRRQIMNLIAEVEEFQGIIADEVSQSKKLDPPSQKYEKQLVNTHKEKFDAVNEMVGRDVQFSDSRRRGAYSIFGHTARSPGSLTPGIEQADIALRGVTLFQLRLLAQQTQTELSKRPGVKWENFTWAHFTNLIYDSLNGRSWAELHSTETQRPQFQLGLRFTTTLRDTISAIEWHAEARGLPDTTVYWCCTLALRHGQENFSTPDLLRILRRSIKRMEGFLLVINSEGGALTRSIPVYELHCALSEQVSVDVATPEGCMAWMRPFADGTWEFGDASICVAKNLLEFRIKAMDESNRGDRDLVLRIIANGQSAMEKEDKAPPPSFCDQYEEFEQRVRLHGAGPVLRWASFGGDVAEIQDVLQKCLQLHNRLDLAILQGPHKETPLHAAAAAGECVAMKLLIDHGCSVNSVDVDGESPLHYACFVGHELAVNLLLLHRADPERSSFLGQTPKDVVCENALGMFNQSGKHEGEKVEMLLRLLKYGPKGQASEIGEIRRDPTSVQVSAKPYKESTDTKCPTIVHVSANLCKESADTKEASQKFKSAGKAVVAAMRFKSNIKTTATPLEHLKAPQNCIVCSAAATNQAEEEKHDDFKELCQKFKDAGEVSPAELEGLFRDEFSKHEIDAIVSSIGLNPDGLLKLDEVLAWCGWSDSEAFERASAETSLRGDEMDEEEETDSDEDNRGLYDHPPVAMAAFEEDRGGCVDCSSLIALASGNMCPIGQLKKGDRVRTLNDLSAEVVCLVRTSCSHGRAKLVELSGGGRLTPWHPVLVDGHWRFPGDLAPTAEFDCEAVCSLVLDGGPAFLLGGNVPCIALGHGLEEGSAAHPYFGTDLVLKDLQRARGFGVGLVELQPSDFLHDVRTGLIGGLRVNAQHPSSLRNLAKKKRKSTKVLCRRALQL